MRRRRRIPSPGRTPPNGARVPALAAAALLLLAAAPGAVSAQATGPDGADHRTRVGLSLEVAEPVDEFDDFADTGVGIDVHLTHDLLAGGALGLRVDGGWVRYGDFTRRVPFSLTVPAVALDLEVENAITTVTGGPQFVLPLGPVRPFAYGGVGFSHFATTSSVEGTRDDREFASTTNFDDFALALTAGGGLSVRITGGDHPLHAVVQGAYLHNGEAQFLKNEDLRRVADGDVLVSPVTSDADLLKLRLGVEIGL